MKGLAAAALVVVVTVVWWRTVTEAPLDPKGLGGDLVTYHQHVQQWLYARLAAGRLPAWNPYQLAGMPAIGTLQGGFYYPLHVLSLLLPIPTALALGTLLHLLLAGAGLLVVGARLGLHPLAALAGALCFTLRGDFPRDAAAFTNVFEAAAWLPWGLVGVLDLLGGRHRRGVVALSAALGLSLLAGHTQVSIYAVYGWASLLVAGLAVRPPSSWGKPAALFAASVLLGLALAATQLVPALELTAQGTRTTRALSVREMFPFGASTVWLFLKFEPSSGLRGFGIPAMVLAVVGTVTGRRWVVAWALLVGALTLALAAGPRTPLFPFLLWMPGLAWFRMPFLVFVVTDLCLAVLVAFGVDALLASPASHARAVLSRRLALAVLVAWGAWEIVRAPLAPSAYPFDRRADDAADTFVPTFREAAALAGDGRLWFAGASTTPSLATKLASRHGLRAIDDYEAVNLARQAEYFNFLKDGTPELRRWPWLWAGLLVPGGDPRGVPPMSARRRLLDALALRVVIVPPGDPDRAIGRFLRPAGFRFLKSSVQGLELWENPAALPRAYTVHRTEPAGGPADLLARLSAPGFDPLVTSFVEGAAGLRPAPDAPARGRAARIVRDEEEEVEIEATLDAPGFVVLADTVYPGWRATVDGAPAPIFPTNHLFRGVPVPSGTHRVRFVYAPWTIPCGIAVSVIVLMILVDLAWRPSRRAAAIPAPTP